MDQGIRLVFHRDIRVHDYDSNDRRSHVWLKPGTYFGEKVPNPHDYH
jgi:hypothetical protein